MNQTTESKGASEADIDVTFSLDAATGDYGLSFHLPGLHGTGTITQTDEVQGSCNPGEDGMKTYPAANFTVPYEGTQVGASGQVAPGSEVIRGDRTDDLSAPVSAPGVVQSRTVTVSWTLYKVN